MATDAEVGGGLAERSAMYREQGWWTGVRLEARFAEFVTEDPSRPAVTDDHGRTLTRAELWDQSGLLAEDLAAHGVEGGHAVLVYLPNCAEWQVVLLACLRLRAIPATLPVNSDSETLAHICRAVGARAIVGAREHRRRPTAEYAKRAADASSHDVDVAILGADNELSWLTSPGRESAPRHPAHVEHLMFTSSTTGLPKAVVHTVDTLAAVNIGFRDRYGLTEDTAIFMPSPMGHSVGSWHGGRLSLYIGAHLVLQDLWDPGAALAAIDRFGCQFTAAATPFLKDILDVALPSEAPRMPSMATFLCGGAPVPAWLIEAAASKAPNTFVSVLWGMTEGGVTTCPPGTPAETVAHSAGCALPGLELSILPADGGSAGVGELAMRGPGVFVGYLGQEDLYRDLLTVDGYFRTGDLASIDSEGFVRLDGRIKDLIIRGGVNISPIPIEDAIAAHPGVRRVAVIGRPDDRLGERICAVVVPSEEPIDLAELQSWLLERGLSQRHLPEFLVLVDQVPVTAAGKIRKVELRRQIEEGL